MTGHDITLTAVDPDADWGMVRMVCSKCGPLGVFHSAYSAYETHSRLGHAAAAQQRNLERGQAIGRSLRGATRYVP